MSYLHQLQEWNNNIQRDLDLKLNYADYLKKINTFLLQFLK